jgi:type I restriction enzyme R subunit
MSITTEKTFETAIVESLTEKGGWMLGNAQAFDRKLALFPATIIDFLQDSQPRQWAKIAAVHGVDVETKLITRLYKELELRGTLDVLWNGFTDYGVRFQMAYFKPESGLNPDTLVLYNKNRLHVTRQVHYSPSNENSLDLLMSINGLPIATAELTLPARR